MIIHSKGVYHPSFEAKLDDKSEAYITDRIAIQKKLSFPHQKLSGSQKKLLSKNPSDLLHQNKQSLHNFTKKRQPYVCNANNEIPKCRQYLSTQVLKCIGTLHQ